MPRMNKISGVIIAPSAYHLLELEGKQIVTRGTSSCVLAQEWKWHWNCAAWTYTFRHCSGFKKACWEGSPNFLCTSDVAFVATSKRALSCRASIDGQWTSSWSNPSGVSLVGRDHMAQSPRSLFWIMLNLQCIASQKGKYVCVRWPGKAIHIVWKPTGFLNWNMFSFGMFLHQM